MKTLRQFCAALFLAATLAMSASAGDIGAPGVTATPTQPSLSTCDPEALDTAATCDVSTTGTTTLETTTEMTLNVIEGVLLLF